MTRKFTGVLRLFAAASMLLGIGNHALSMLGHTGDGDAGTLLTVQALALFTLAEVLDMRRDYRR